MENENSVHIKWFRWQKHEDEYLLSTINSGKKLKEKAAFLGRTKEATRNRMKFLKAKDTIVSKKVEIGERYGKLVVISLGRLKGFLSATCECDCGNFITTRIYTLLDNKAQSCGCNQIEFVKKMCIREPGKISFTTQHSIYKHNAKKNNRDFELTVEQTKDLMIQNCFFCNQEPRPYNVYVKKDGRIVKDRRTIITKEIVDRAWIKINGIDRIDNSKGYLTNNCVPCCPDCNGAKTDMTLYNWLSYIERFEQGFTKKMLEKLEKAGIVLPPKEKT